LLYYEKSSRFEDAIIARSLCITRSGRNQRECLVDPDLAAGLWTPTMDTPQPEHPGVNVWIT
jgi:hypothetical protein